MVYGKVSLKKLNFILFYSVVLLLLNLARYQDLSAALKPSSSISCWRCGGCRIRVKLRPPLLERPILIHVARLAKKCL